MCTILRIKSNGETFLGITSTSLRLIKWLSIHLVTLMSTINQKRHFKNTQTFRFNQFSILSMWKQLELIADMNYLAQPYQRTQKWLPLTMTVTVKCDEVIKQFISISLLCQKHSCCFRADSGKKDSGKNAFVFNSKKKNGIILKKVQNAILFNFEFFEWMSEINNFSLFLFFEFLKMRRIAEFKRDYADTVKGLMPVDEEEAFKNGNVVNILSNLDQDGRRVMIVHCGKIWDTKKVTSEQMFKLFYMIHMAALIEENTQVRGAVVIMDFDGMGMSQVLALTPSWSKRLLVFIQDAMPIRLKQVHMVNQPYIFNMVWKLFKPFVKEKLSKRVRLPYFLHDLLIVFSSILKNIVSFLLLNWFSDVLPWKGSQVTVQAY